MGCDFHWLMCALDDDELVKFRKEFDGIIERSKLKPEQQATLELFEKSPESILPRYVPVDKLPEHMDKDIYKNGYIDNKNSIEFSSIFWINEISDIALKLPLSEENVLSWESYETQPFSVLVYSLGLDINASIPGVYGNMFVEHEELPIAIKSAKCALKKFDRESLTRARRFISDCSVGKISYQHDKEIKTLVNSLFKQMKKAHKTKKNFMALSFWMG